MSLLRRLFKILFWLFALIGAAGVAVAAVILIGVLNIEKPQPRISDGAVLTLDLTGGLTESSRDKWWEPWRKSMTLPEVVLALEAAAKDPRIYGLLLRANTYLDFAGAQELRGALKTFRDAGKVIHAYADSFGESGDGVVTYYVAAAANKIFLQPSGDVGLFGFRLEVPFVKGALDHLGIEARASFRKEYKGAPYSFTQSTMPEPMRRNLQRLVDSWFDQLIGDIAADRGVDRAVAQGWIDRSPWGAEEARRQGVVDALAYWDEARQSLGDAKNMVALDAYWAQRPDPPGNAPVIAVLTALGPIALGSPERSPFGEEEVIGSADFAKSVSAAIDDKVAAILLRIDSPGGSYVGADQIWREINRAKSTGIPVVVSMRGTAASGGYFIAAPATKIVANPATITGSIGVFGGKPVLSGLLAKLGISIEGVEAGAAAAFSSMSVDFSPSAWARLEARMDEIYADFVGKVAAGRGFSADQAEAVAKGQIWSGADAKANGLVDELGGFSTALKLAMETAKLAPDADIRLIPYPTPQSPLQRLMEIAQGSAEAPEPTAALALRALLGKDAVAIMSAARPEAEGPLRLMPLILNGRPL